MPDFITAFTAILFFLANALLIAFYAKERQRRHFDRDALYDLDTDYIETEWNFRLDNNALWLAAGFINAFAWLFLCFPIIQMAWVLSHKGKGRSTLHIAIAFFALAGSFTEWFSRLYWFGSSLATKMLVRDFNLDTWYTNGGDGDKIGWKVLEVAHLITSGYIWFIDSVEWLFLALILILTYFTVREWRVEDATSFGACWNSMGLFLGLMCILEFTAEVLRFDGYRTFGPIAIVYAVLNRLILIPLWLLRLSFMLPRALAKAQLVEGNAMPGGELELHASVVTNNNDATAADNLFPDQTDDRLAPPAQTTASPPPAAFAPQSSTPQAPSDGHELS